ncbi:hypothetical protein C0J09_08275 [Bordetella avium]|uniref:acyl carrier protein n=1 Tax=Bordetella avium TaxID=521 RepID=UPI000FDAE83B|nr:acyl carrier protein [Bordetella avium]AZY49140.1 hypothetical protein C0J09_08275 [Bordetella avium]
MSPFLPTQAMMQNPPIDPVLPEDAVLRGKLAKIIAGVCRCEPEPLLDDQPFTTVITQFDSLAILEILLEVETEFHIATDEMLPSDPASNTTEITAVFPANLSALVSYMHEVVARRATGQAATDDHEARRRARLAAATRNENNTTP